MFFLMEVENNCDFKNVSLLYITYKQVSFDSKVEPVIAEADSTQKAQATANISPPAVDFATDLFNMLSVDGPSENASESPSLDDNAWAGFQCK